MNHYVRIRSTPVELLPWSLRVAPIDGMLPREPMRGPSAVRLARPQHAKASGLSLSTDREHRARLMAALDTVNLSLGGTPFPLPRLASRTQLIDALAKAVAALHYAD